MKRITGITELTPVEEYHGILFKRDDLFLPFDDSNLGGCKTRQMLMLYKAIQLNKEVNIKGIITTTSVQSPQGLIVAKIANLNETKAIICIGSNSDSVKSVITRHKSIWLPYKLGAEIRIVSKLGYNSILKSSALQIAKDLGYEYIDFGINMDQYPEAIVGSVANQVQNLPDNIDNLIIPVGSGVTMGGILVGLSKFGKTVKRTLGIQISGFDRRNRINKILEIFNVKYDYEFYIDKTYIYTKNIEHYVSPDFELSVKYESKAYKYFLRNMSQLGIKKTDQTLFYCIGNNNFIY